jgi:uncharacterized protein (TIGR03437 family)
VLFNTTSSEKPDPSRDREGAIVSEKERPGSKLQFSKMFRVINAKLSGMRHRLPLLLAIVLAVSTALLAQQRSFTEYFLPSVPGLPVSPLGLATGSDGNVWFTDYGSSRIGKISTKGEATIFAIPSNPAYPTAITSGPDGNLWFVETLSNKIGRITTAGVLTEFSTPTAGATPVAIVAGTDGNLWFPEHAGFANRIGRITPAGLITEFPIPTSLSNPTGIASGPDGNLWFTEANTSKIGKITPSGSITEFAIPPHSGNNPQLIVTGPDGNLWFTESGNTVGRITPAGAISEFTLNGSVTSLVTFQNAVWFADAANNAIGEIGPSGSIAEFTIPTSHSNPSGIAAGPDGNLWFTEQNASKIGVLSGVTTGVIAPSVSAVVNAASGAPGICSNTWLTIIGSNLAPPGDTRAWMQSDFVGGLMPQVLDGVSVTIDGVNAYVSYISANQLNVLAPVPPPGKGYVQVTNNGVAGGAFLAPIAQYSPSFFVLNGGPYVAAVHADGTLVGPTSLFPGSSTPAKPGEVILVYGNGFGTVPGPYTPGSPAQTGSPAVTPVVTIGGVTATTQFVGLTSAGLFQFNVVVPASSPNGDNAIAAKTGPFGLLTTQSGALIAVQQ